MRNRVLNLLVSGLAFVAIAGQTRADDVNSGHSALSMMDQPTIEHKFQINPGFTYFAEADFDDKALGDISSWRFDLPGRYTMTTDRGELGLGALYEYTEYEFSNAGGDHKFNTLAFDAYWKGMFNENWGYFLYGGLAMSADTDADLTDGVTGVGAGGVRYVWSKDLSLGVGLSVASRLEDDPLVRPVIILNWQINDRWNLRVFNGATITWDVRGDKVWLLDAGVRYNRREWRLKEGGDDASVIDRMVMAELGATYRFGDRCSVRGFVGLTAGREVELRANDDEITEQDVDTSPYFGVRLMFTF